MAELCIPRLPRLGKVLIIPAVLAVLSAIYPLVASSQGFPPQSSPYFSSKDIASAGIDYDREALQRRYFGAGDKESSSEYFSDFTTAEKWWLAAAVTGLVVDWRQTRYIAGHPQEYSERNPILGEHPSQGTVDAYFAASAVGTAMIAYALPHKWRKAWLIGVTSISVICISNNVGIGVGFQW